MSAFPISAQLDEVDRNASPVFCCATDYPVNAIIDSHSHGKHQLVYAVSGVLAVKAEAGQWIVPPNRAIWMPAGMVHSIRCIGVARMRSVFVAPSAAPHLPPRCQAVLVSPLLRELIQAASVVSYPYPDDSRDSRLMSLILDELRLLPELPLHLPQPQDARLRIICEQLQRQPDDLSTLGDWSARLGMDVKTIQRRFARETGMTFGQWRQQTRLLRALECLANGDKIVDIALGLGYDSPSAFATMFKKQFGLPPREFFASGSDAAP